MFDFFDENYNELNEFMDMLDALSEINLKDFQNFGLDFNFSSVVNDGTVEVGANYKDTSGLKFNVHEKGSNVADVVESCLAQVAASLAEEEQETLEQKDAKIAKLEARIAELEADLNVQRVRNEKHVNEKKKEQKKYEQALNDDIDDDDIFAIYDFLKRFC